MNSRRGMQPWISVSTELPINYSLVDIYVDCERFTDMFFENGKFWEMVDPHNGTVEEWDDVEYWMYVPTAPSYVIG